MKTMSNSMKSFAIAAIVFVVVTVALLNATSIPDVHVSHSTGQCVKVINYEETDYTCDNLPSKYNHVWVQ